MRADSPTYMRWLLTRVKARGGVCISARITSFSELAAHFRIVVNATGLGARELAADERVHAYRGQVIRVHAPHIERWTVSYVSATTCTYVLPRLSSGIVTCGGTYQRDDECEPIALEAIGQVLGDDRGQTE